jgi:hypothetical protein
MYVLYVFIAILKAVIKDDVYVQKIIKPILAKKPYLQINALLFLYLFFKKQ